MAASYGGAQLPSGSRIDITDPGAQKRGGVNFAMQSIGFLAMPPLVMFVSMVIAFAFLSGTNLPLALTLAVICMAFAALFGNIGKGYVKGPVYTMLSVLSFIAIAAGIMAGLSIQARFFGPYWQYSHRPAYSDVLATEAAAARADAGIINFASNTVVDTFRSGNILSAHGRRFCAAPILDESQQTVAEYWAVGMDCCEGHVGYYCDDAQVASAKSGAVVFQMDSWLVRDPYSKYLAAVKQSAMRNQLQIPENPILVRWVKDPSTITDGLWGEGMTHLVVSIAGYAVASAIVASVLHTASSR